MSKRKCTKVHKKKNLSVCLCLSVSEAVNVCLCHPAPAAIGATSRHARSTTPSHPSVRERSKTCHKSLPGTPPRPTMTMSKLYPTHKGPAMHIPAHDTEGLKDTSSTRLHLTPFHVCPHCIPMSIRAKN